MTAWFELKVLTKIFNKFIYKYLLTMFNLIYQVVPQFGSTSKVSQQNILQGSFFELLTLFLMKIIIILIKIGSGSDWKVWIIKQNISANS